MDLPEKTINEILDKNPSQETLHVLLPILMEKGNLERVIGECLKSLARFPEDYTIRKILAEAYFADDKLSEAEVETDLIIKSLQKLAESYRLKADILIKQNRDIEAIKYLEQFIVFYPEDERALSLLNSIPESKEKDAGEILQVTEDETVEQAQAPEIPPETLDTKSDEESAKRKKERLIEILNTWRGSFKEEPDPELTAH